MAAGILSKPGAEYGPCVDACEHLDCKSLRTIAESVCPLCQKPVGYERRFYHITPDLVAGIEDAYGHASCVEDAIEIEMRERGWRLQ